MQQEADTTTHSKNTKNCEGGKRGEKVPDKRRGPRNKPCPLSCDPQSPPACERKGKLDRVRVRVRVRLGKVRVRLELG